MADQQQQQQMLPMQVSVNTANASVTKDAPAPCASSSSSIAPYITDQLCHGFSPPGLIFQAPRLNTVPGSVTYHGLQGPMTVGHLGTLTYQRPTNAINPTGLVQLGSGSIIGLSPGVVHQNPPVSGTVHPANGVGGGTNQMVHVTGRLSGVVDHMMQDVNSVPYQHAISNANSAAGKLVSEPPQLVSTVVNYVDVQNAGGLVKAGGTKPGLPIIANTDFSNVFYPNIILTDNAAKSCAVTTNPNLPCLGLTFANAAVSTVPLTTTMPVTQTDNFSVNKTEPCSSSSTSNAMTTSSGMTVTSSAPLQCVTLDTLASGMVVVSEDSSILQGQADTKNVVSSDTVDEKKETIPKLQSTAEGSSGLPSALPSDYDGVSSVVGVDDVCRGLASTIVYLEQHPDVAPGHVETLRQILQKVIEADHNTFIGKCGTIKVEVDVDAKDFEGGGKIKGKRVRSGKLKVNSGSVTQWVMDNPYRCKTCGKRFPQYSYLTEHMAVHGSGTPQCSACGEIFNDEDSLSVHRKMDCRCYVQCDVCGHEYNAVQRPPPHLSLKPLTRNTCSRCIAEINAVKQQLIAVHSSKKPYDCATCSAENRATCRHATSSKPKKSRSADQPEGS